MKKNKKVILICRNMGCDDIASLFDERSLRNPKTCPDYRNGKCNYDNIKCIVYRYKKVV